MSKERLTVSLDPELVNQLQEKTDNQSGTVNRLLREYFKSGGSGPMALEVRIRDLEQRIEEALNERDRVNRRIERLRNEKERVEREIEGRQEKEREKLEEAKEYVRGKQPDNPAVQNWAEKLGMTPAELIHRVGELNGVEA